MEQASRVEIARGARAIQNENEVPSDEEDAMHPVDSKTPSSFAELIRKEVDNIVHIGNRTSQPSADFEEGNEQLKPKEPITVTKNSSKTLKWLYAIMEASFGATADSIILPMSNLPAIPVDERKITLLEYEVSDFEQPVTYENMSMLSKLIGIWVKYKDGYTDEDKTANFIVKVPPENSEERDLVDMSRSDRREIFCYSRIFPYLQQWSLEQNVEVVFAIPRCYFARINRKLDMHAVQEIHENIPEAETILLFQDLRPLGFGKRHFLEGLTIEEAKAAICEIAKLHSLSYALQQWSKLRLTEIFGPLHKPMESALMYDVLLEEAFPTVIKLLESCDFDTVEIIRKLKSLQSRIRGTLTSLMEPHPSPYPTCLTHMDFWCDNIVFRRKDDWDSIPREWEGNGEQDDDQEASNISSTTTSSAAKIDGVIGLNSILKNAAERERSTSIQDSPLECRILDWQMVSYGRPSHDLALLLLTSLQTDVRRKYTNMLLKYYYQVFKNTAQVFGAEIYFDLHWLHREYKKSKVLALLFVIASVHLALADPLTQERLIEMIAEVAGEGNM